MGTTSAHASADETPYPSEFLGDLFRIVFATGPYDVGVERRCLMDERRQRQAQDGDVKTGRPHARNASRQRGDDPRLVPGMAQQVPDMHRTVLAKAVDPAVALFQARRRPRQLHMYDQTARALQVQAFGGNIGGNQHPRLTAAKLRERYRTSATAGTAVQGADGGFLREAG